MDVSGEQARFDLTGDQSPLFKNNYVSVMDFKSVIFLRAFSFFPKRGR